MLPTASIDDSLICAGAALDGGPGTTITYTGSARTCNLRDGGTVSLGINTPNVEQYGLVSVNGQHAVLNNPLPDFRDFCFSFMARPSQAFGSAGYIFQWGTAATANSWSLSQTGGSIVADAYDASGLRRIWNTPESPGAHNYAFLWRHGVWRPYRDGAPMDLNATQVIGPAYMTTQPATGRLGESASDVNRYVGWVRDVMITYDSACNTDMPAPTANSLAIVGDVWPGGSSLLAFTTDWGTALEAAVGGNFRARNLGMNNIRATANRAIFEASVKARGYKYVAIHTGVIDLWCAGYTSAQVSPIYTGIANAALADGATAVVFVLPTPGKTSALSGCPWSAAKQTQIGLVRAAELAYCAADPAHAFCVDEYATFGDVDPDALAAAYDGAATHVLLNNAAHAQIAADVKTALGL